jgi:hypothetical protein
MKYDDASWHYGGDFPKDLPATAGATHTGMFLVWAILNGLAGEIHLVEFPEILNKLRTREISPGQFLLQACDEKFTDEDLSEEGNLFAQAYFDLQKGAYLSDYEKTLANGLPSTYHVADTWDNYDKLNPIISERFKAWKKHNKKGWQFWKR